MPRVWMVVLCLLPALAAAQPLQQVQILHEFATSPSWANGGLVQVPDGSFYGVTIDAIYRVAPDGQVTVAGRITDGTFALGTLVRGPDGALYGTTQFGGSGGLGTVFRFDPATGDVRTLHAFGGAGDGFGEPIGGLALAGGFLYGVTRSQLFKVDPATGATTTEFVFSATEGPRIFDPSGPLTVGADGLLYGTTRAGPGEQPPSKGALYSFDPAAPGGITVRHAFTNPTFPEGRLRLGTDHRLYGSALGTGFNVGGAVYRFDPATDALEVLHTFPEGNGGGPGPVVIAPDGSLYGTTLASTNIVPNLVGVLFRLRPGAGGYTYETLRTFDLATSGLSDRAELALGADGLIYGYSQSGGPAGSGTVYRFDPAEGGAAPDPLAFTVLHTFAPATTWGPSAPVLGRTGVAYGTTSRGGPTQRGAVYELNRATGAVTFPAVIPGTPTGMSNGWNSSMAFGLDNALYATSAMATATTLENAIVRFAPEFFPVTTTTALLTTQPGTGRPAPDSAMALVPSGELYFMRGISAMRYNPANGTLTLAGQAPNPGAFGFSSTTAPLVATDGQVYVGVSTSVEYGTLPFCCITTVRVMRIDQAANALVEVANLGSSISLGGLAQGADGALYLGGSTGSGSQIQRIDPVTGAHQPVCTFADGGLQHLSVAPDTRLVGVTGFGSPQKLLLCTPSTGAVEVRVLPHAIGRISAPLVAIGGALYGATWDQRFAPLVPQQGPAPAQPGGALIRLVPGGTPPALDTDGDGLPSEWETAYGLDPFSVAAGNGATGDPDGDGRTNAQELAAGTHPRGFVRRYFAEGATGSFFRTRFDLANPNGASTATVLVSYLTDTGGRVVQDVLVPPMTHVSIDPSTLVPLASANFSTVIESDATVAVSRTMTWDATGYGSHIETGVVAPAATWYLAEGSTSGPFALFYLLQNPQALPVNATVRYLRPGGLPPIERTYTLLPNSRRTIAVDGEGGELASTDVSAVIIADAPIVAERAMYYSQPNQAFAAGHESAGVTAPALEWFFAEGATGPFFDLFVLIANPGAAAADVEVEYLLIGGGAMTKTYTVPGHARTTIWVDDEQLPAGSGQKPLANVAVSMRVHSTNGVPIVAERTMWWPGPSLTPAFWYEAHNSPGATASALRWVAAGGEIGGPSGAQTYVLIANPGPAAGQARITALTANGRQHIGDVTLPAKSRTNVPFAAPLTYGLDGPFSILVESIGTTPVPIVVEHAMYTSPGGVVWASGGNALAAPIP